MADSKRDILIVGLRNAYGLEGQALSTMRNASDRLTNYPQLKAAVAQHISETERQQQWSRRPSAASARRPRPEGSRDEARRQHPGDGHAWPGTRC